MGHISGPHGLIVTKGIVSGYVLSAGRFTVKAVIEFDLTDEDDKLEFEYCKAAAAMASALDDIKQEVRKHWKYGDYKHDETYDIVEKIYEHICDQLVERGLGDI